MPLESMSDLMGRAQREGYALGYFEAWGSYSIEAVTEAAEAEHAAVILGFGCMMAAPQWLERAGIEILAGIGRAVAERVKVPVALLLNEAQTFEQARRAMDAGFNAVMLDTSAWLYHDAVVAVRELVELARARGVSVEAELGRLPDAEAEGIDTSAARLTDAEEAAAFVTGTGVDCLAVSIGNVHLLSSGYAAVDMERLAAIHSKVRIPLVIHGGTSFPPEFVPRAIECGVAKFNVGTALKIAFLDGIRETVDTLPERADPHRVLGSHTDSDMMARGQAAMREKVRELIRLYGGSGRA